MSRPAEGTPELRDAASSCLQRLAPEGKPGRQQEHPGVGEGIDGCGGAVLQLKGVVLKDHLADIKPFQVWHGKVSRIEEPADPSPNVPANLVEMPPQKKFPRDHHENDGA